MEGEAIVGPVVDAADDQSPAISPSRTRRALRFVLLWLVPAVALLSAACLYGRGGTIAETDNAYVRQDRVDVTALVSADVRAVHVRENARVEAGQLVLELDDARLRSAVARAAADLENARMQIATLRAAYRAKQGEVAVARETAQFANRQLGRQRELVSRKLVAEAALDEAQRAADAANGQVAVLELQLAELRTQLAGDPGLPAEAHPSVQAAAAELDRATVDLRDAAVRAPKSGIVSHLPQVGDHVEAGRAAFALVLSDDVYVEANLKETDVGWVKPGQPARVEVDLYPGIVWHGHVESVAQATGSEFSLLPAQNASGNWVKVVQRIPVRIVLDRAPPSHPTLRSGASAEVAIQTDAPTRLRRWLDRLHG
jgi:membrane fusion protein (multidrug efflux system)